MMDKETQEAHKAWAEMLKEIKDILEEAQLGPISLLELVEYVKDCREILNLNFRLAKHQESGENRPEVG